MCLSSAYEEAVAMPTDEDEEDICCRGEMTFGTCCCWAAGGKGEDVVGGENRLVDVSGGFVGNEDEEVEGLTIAEGEAVAFGLGGGPPGTVEGE